MIKTKKNVSAALWWNLSPVYMDKAFFEYKKYREKIKTPEAWFVCTTENRKKTSCVKRQQSWTDVSCFFRTQSLKGPWWGWRGIMPVPHFLHYRAHLNIFNVLKKQFIIILQSSVCECSLAAGLATLRLPFVRSNKYQHWTRNDLKNWVYCVVFCYNVH